MLTGTEYHSLLHTLQLMRYFLERYPQFELLEGFETKISNETMPSYLNDQIPFQEHRKHVSWKSRNESAKPNAKASTMTSRIASNKFQLSFGELRQRFLIKITC